MKLIARFKLLDIKSGNAPRATFDGDNRSYTVEDVQIATFQVEESDDKFYKAHPKGTLELALTGQAPDLKVGNLYSVTVESI